MVISESVVLPCHNTNIKKGRATTRDPRDPRRDPQGALLGSRYTQPAIKSGFPLGMCWSLCAPYHEGSDRVLVLRPAAPAAACGVAPPARARIPFLDMSRNRPKTFLSAALVASRRHKRPPPARFGVQVASVILRGIKSLRNAQPGQSYRLLICRSWVRIPPWVRPGGVAVSTLDFESNDTGSNPVRD